VVTPPAADDPTQATDVTALVDAIAHGRDGIALPSDLTAETTSAAPSEERAQSLAGRIRTLSVAERVKLALRGNKEARTLLARDSNSVVVRLLLENPRLTEDEVVAIANNRNADEELLRAIAMRREWTKNYQVRVGLVGNPKTPVPLALRFLALLDDRDVRRLAKSKSVPDAIVGGARRLVAARQVRSEGKS
jgi:hypothetical protein